jgi:hypothetical protein
VHFESPDGCNPVGSSRAVLSGHFYGRCRFGHLAEQGVHPRHRLQRTGDGYATLNINGVTFTSGGIGDQTATLKYNLGHPSLDPFSIGTFGSNFDPGLSGNIDKLLRNFFYGDNANESLLLTGLSPNTTYVACFYGAAFGAKGGRYDLVSDSQGGYVYYDENQTNGTTMGSILTDTYTTGPGQTTINFTWAIDTVDGIGSVTTNVDSYHQYGFTNEVAPEPASFGLLVFAATAVLARRRRAASQYGRL